MNKNSPAYVLGFMVVICALCGIAVSSVQFSMKKTLDTNAQLARNRTIARAFNLAVDGQSASAWGSALSRNVKEDSITAEHHRWETFTSLAAPRDIGILIRGMGFWDYITCIIVMSNNLDTIRSFEVIEQKETPGLGARIEEKSFRDQFKNYPVNWAGSSGGKVLTFNAPASNGARIDGITGATQTSIALERFLNSELIAFKKAFAGNSKNGVTTPVGR